MAAPFLRAMSIQEDYHNGEQDAMEEHKAKQVKA